MLDDLRTRIAAAVDQVLNPPCCDECKPFRPEDESYELADAVIRELGLRTEWLTDAGSRLGIPHLTKPDNPIATRTASPWTAHTHQDTP